MHRPPPRRQLHLASLPPYLCVSLQRFVFDLKVRLCLVWGALLESLPIHLCVLQHCSPSYKPIED